MLLADSFTMCQTAFSVMPSLHAFPTLLTLRNNLSRSITAASSQSSSFTNAGGVATVTFLSDTDLSTVTTSGLPILGQFTEGHKLIFISVALGNGNFLRAKICSDVNETTGCSGTSDSISLSERSSVVPEPGTLLLFGTGLFSTGVLKFRRLLKGM
jgi:hypothetical protein